MKVLITGVNGFVGSYLAEYALNKGADVYGTIRHFRSDTANIKNIGFLKLVVCDMTDAKNVYDVINRLRPDKIFHLAAQSYVKASWDAPTETMNNNIAGEINLFEAVRQINDYNPVIQIAGSSEEYGMVHGNEVPIKETNPLRPLSPYGVSKVAQDLLAYQYFMSYSLNVIRTRAFNHTGARRGEVFAESDWAKQIAQGDVVKVGNLDAVRDYTDVRDMVEAYWLATEKCLYGEEYNICSGNGYPMEEILVALVEASGKPIRVEKDKSRLRPSDVPILIGDSSKFREATGWAPKHNIITDTLPWLLNYWKEQV